MVIYKKKYIFISQKVIYILNIVVMFANRKNALYGLKQAPRAWYQKLVKCLSSAGFQESKEDPSLFLNFQAQGKRNGNHLYLCE